MKHRVLAKFKCLDTYPTKTPVGMFVQRQSLALNLKAKTILFFPVASFVLLLIRGASTRPFNNFSLLPFNLSIYQSINPVHP